MRRHWEKETAVRFDQQELWEFFDCFVPLEVPESRNTDQEQEHAPVNRCEGLDMFDMLKSA